MSKIKVTKELIKKLTRAQTTHAAGLLADDHWQYSVDGWDYAQAAASLACIMLHIYENNDVKRLDKLLNNTDRDGECLIDFACDGVCPEFYKLKPPSLEID